MADRKVFADSVTPLPPEAGPTVNGLIVHNVEPEQRQEPMTVLFSLEVPPSARESLEERVAKGEVVPQPELDKLYTADAKARQDLVTWLTAQGFAITQVTADGTGVYASAPVDQIAKSLAVTMTRVTKDGITYTAAADAPSLPSDVGRAVHAIIGLQPFRQMHKHSRCYLPPTIRRPAAVGMEGAGGVGLATAAAEEQPAVSANAPPYTVSDILRAYNADNLGVTGKGQTIAILIDTFPDDNDLKAFWARNGLSINLNQIQKINVSGKPLPPRQMEETLDASWASGIAPGATIRIYASGSLSFVDLDLALDRIIADLPSQPGMRQLSISLGLGETFMGGPQGEVAIQHQKFLRLAAAGVNVFVSSGDAGSNPDNTGHGSNGPLQAEYESSDSVVVGVGGTTLTMAPNGTVSSEKGWTGSGGGTSIFFSRPAWQAGITVPTANSANRRLVPDVSLAADPNKGALLVFQGDETQIGGTSWSAPVWAGFCALLNEARLKAGKPALGFLNPLIYPLRGTPSFRDISGGTNGAFTASAGYDLVTGIGVPNVKALMTVFTTTT
jgi:kumamolisin